MPMTAGASLVAVWFTGSAAYQLHLMRHKPWLPFYMGGSRQFDDADFWKPDPSMDVVYKVPIAWVVIGT